MSRYRPLRQASRGAFRALSIALCVATLLQIAPARLAETNADPDRRHPRADEGSFLPVQSAFAQSVAIASSPTAVPTPIQADAHNSLLVDGLTGYAEAPNEPELNTTGDWTVEAWFKDEDPNGFNHENRTILSKGDTNPNLEVPYLVQVGHNNIIAGLRTGGQNSLITFDLNALGLKPRDWHHVAVSFNATLNVLNLWLDGQHITYLTVPGHGTTGNALPLDIGRKGPTTGNYWLGKLDDVRIWSVARKGSDITATYRNELSGPQAGLVANWRFDDGGGTSASDGAGTHVASLIGGASFSGDVHP